MHDETKLKVAIYSIDSLAVSLSSQTQQDTLCQIATERGWQIVSNHADRHAEHRPGRRAARLGYHALSHAVRTRKVDVVMVATVAAIGSDMDDLRKFAGLLAGHGVGLHVADDPEGGPALLAAAGALKSVERAKRRQRARAGQEKARKEGRHIGRPPIPDDVVEQVRAAVAAGHGIRPTARKFGIGAASVVRIASGEVPPAASEPVPR